MMLPDLRKLCKNGKIEEVAEIIHLYPLADKNNALGWTCYYGRLKMTKFLLDNGANDDYALIASSTREHLNIVKLLLSRGATVKAKNDALIEASIKGNLKLVKLLLQHGANILPDTFRFAKHNGQTEIINYFNNQLLLNKIKDMDNLIT
jgi:ankyrin repeat protein